MSNQRQRDSQARRNRDLLQQAMATAPRRDDGGVDEKPVLDYIASRIPFDEEAERLKIAKELLGRSQRPGKTEPHGLVCLPGFEKFAWEPDRIISDGSGHLVRQEEARPEYKSAEAERARLNARRVNQWNDRKQAENSAYAKWAFEQITLHQRPLVDITYGNFVREAGWWENGEADPEPQPDASDD